MFRETAIRPLFGLKKERNMLFYLSALGSRCMPQGGQRKVRTRNDGDRISIIRTVAGNARRGNPRDANRDADAERLGTLHPVGDSTESRVSFMETWRCNGKNPTCVQGRVQPQF